MKKNIKILAGSAILAVASYRRSRVPNKLSSRRWWHTFSEYRSTNGGYRHCIMAKGMDVDFEVIDAKECQRRHPLISTKNLIGGLWDPLDGDIDPYQLCHALTRKARQAGAEVYTNTPVTGLKTI